MSLRPESNDYEGVSSRRRDTSAVTPLLEEWLRSGSGQSERVRTKSDSSAQIETDKVPFEALSSSPVEKWVRNRGHTLSFAALFIFSIILYLRPYELIPALSSFKSMAFYSGLITLAIFFATQLSLEGNLTARPREVDLAVLLGLAALLSIPLAISPGEAWKTFTELIIKMLVIFIVMVNVLRTERRLNLLLLLVLGVSVYLSISAIQDYHLGVFGIGRLEDNDLRVAGRIKGLFENSNDLALHLVTMAPIAVGLALANRGVILKTALFCAAALMSVAVIVTFSRGGFLGVMASSIVLARKLGRRNKAGTTLAIVFGIILFLGFAPGSYSGRLSSIFDSTADLTGSSSQRTQILKRSVWVALRHPLFGVGVGNFHHKSFRELGTHNAYTQVASEMGIAAMIIYILFLIHPMRRLRQIERESYVQRRNTKFYYMSIGLQASLVGFMVSSFFGAVAYQWYAYYLVSYAVCLHRLYLIKHGTDLLPLRRWEHPFSKNKTPDYDEREQPINGALETAR
ncbi:MAG TPA: O-antigen ligase family protein [Pyrinomonadaceae bacterium]|nr:O-antigen ligase family protein [Pyrinomonadaceae bacterium]